MKESNTSKRLKYIISERGLRQVDILELCKPYCKEYGIKLGKNDLSQYISGKTSPKQDKLFVLSKALGVNEAWLMGFDVPMHGKQTQEKMETIYDRIKRLRKEKGMSQEELALKVGYKERSAINHIENGKRDISGSRILAIANALNVTPSYLMDGESDVETETQEMLFNEVWKQLTPEQQEEVKRYAEYLLSKQENE